jgi:hypothetical protein
MNTDSPLRSLSPHQYTLLMEQAKRDALRLRREAIADFWASIGNALRAALKSAGRHMKNNAIASIPRKRKSAPCPR